MSMHHPSIGPISEANLDDVASLASDFARSLTRLHIKDPNHQRRQAAVDVLKEYEQAGDDVDELHDFLKVAAEVLEQYCQPFMSFGECPEGQFGFWPDIATLDEHARDGDGVLKVNAGDEWPRLRQPDGTYIGYVMEVNDHGNVTLFDARRREVWSCV